MKLELAKVEIFILLNQHYAKTFLPVRCGKGVLLAAILVLQVFLLQAKSSEFIPTTADDGTQTSTMEVTDLFSRTTTITITGGMKLFFPQRKQGFMDGDKLIVCNAQGDPVSQVDLNQISFIKFINFPKSAALPSVCCLPSVPCVAFPPSVCCRLPFRVFQRRCNLPSPFPKKTRQHLLRWNQL